MKTALIVVGVVIVIIAMLLQTVRHYNKVTGQVIESWKEYYENLNKHQNKLE